MNTTQEPEREADAGASEEKTEAALQSSGAADSPAAESTRVQTDSPASSTAPPEAAATTTHVAGSAPDASASAAPISPRTSSTSEQAGAPDQDSARENAQRQNAALFSSAQVTVLQPMTNLKGWEPPPRPAVPEDEKIILSTWTTAMERGLREDRPADTVRLSHVVLRQLPRHLGTYQRLVRAAWMLRRWEEGDAWGRRLLRADPANAVAWRAVAMAAEQRGERARAHARWQRAFECDPYEPEIRAGLVRTSVDLARLPMLNEAALASLSLRGFRWQQAAETYRKLIQQDARRLDYQTGLLLAIWQLQRYEEAYELARDLTTSQPYLLAAWVVIDEAGDANDKALARHPVQTMDPDGDYLRTALGLVYPGQAVRMNVTNDDKALLVALSPQGVAT